MLEAPARLDDARRQLDLYFEGRLREFDLPLDWRLSKGFRRRALRAIARIPYGKTRSYTQIAASAGNERAVRAAGTACGSNPIPIVVPCHRVLRSGGALGGYGGGLPMKQALLELEGGARRVAKGRAAPADGAHAEQDCRSRRHRSSWRSCCSLGAPRTRRSQLAPSRSTAPVRAKKSMTKSKREGE